MNGAIDPITSIRRAKDKAGAAYISTSQPKKLVIKSFKGRLINLVKPSIPDDYEQQTWVSLQAAVHAIHNKAKVPNSLEQLYKCCENMCHYKKQQSMYSNLLTICRQHMQQRLQHLKSNMNESNIIGLVEDAWKDHCCQMTMIRNIFLYLDRTWLFQSGSHKGIWDMGLDLFRDILIQDQDVKTKLLNGLMLQIDQSRDGLLVQEQSLRSMTKMLIELSIYLSVFDGLFIQRTIDYYTLKSNSWMDRLKAVSEKGKVLQQYLDYVEGSIKKELQSCDKIQGFVDLSSRKALDLALHSTLVQGPCQTLLENGLTELFASHSLSHLKCLYQLLSQKGNQELLIGKFAQYIQINVALHVMDKDKDNNMVNILLDFKRKVDEITKDAFGGQESIHHHVKESFEIGINKRTNKPAEMIAKFIDKLLKSGKGMTEAEVDSKLDQCLDLFRFVQGKDIFEAFYGKDLAKRLLLQKSSSVDAEKSMLTKLKSECGAGFTNKLEGMFKDVELSKEIMTSFRQAARYQDRLPSFDLNVNVLTSGFWPTYPVTDMILPQEFLNCQQVFKEFYLNKYNGRRLTWQNSLGHCAVRSVFSKV